nr:hypothetical protein [Kibdelosporangium sp. MJ126-NF4]CTQ95539.1 hypothetical protein [Kibdelosporangium sp. MJ126-NF4]
MDTCQSSVNDRATREWDGGRCRATRTSWGWVLVNGKGHTRQRSRGYWGAGPSGGLGSGVSR